MSDDSGRNSREETTGNAGDKKSTQLSESGTTSCGEERKIPQPETFTHSDSGNYRSRFGSVQTTTNERLGNADLGLSASYRTESVSRECISGVDDVSVMWSTLESKDGPGRCLLDLLDAPNCEFEAFRHNVRNIYMLTAQYNDDNSNDDSIRALCEQHANQGGYFLLNLRNCPKEQDPIWDISLGFRTNMPGLIRSFSETGELLHLHFDSAKRVAEAAVESAIARFQRTDSARR